MALVFALRYEGRWKTEDGRRELTHYVEACDSIQKKPAIEMNSLAGFLFVVAILNMQWSIICRGQTGFLKRFGIRWMCM